MDRKPRTPEEILEYRKRWFRLTGIFAVVLWLLWFVFAVMLAFFTADEPIARFGQVGDAFGSLNAIFGGAGFLGLLYTIYRQHLDTLEGEQRRRDDKREEESRRAEAEDRHNEGIAAQERIALIHASTTLLTVKRDRLKSLERDYKEIKELNRLFCSWCDKQDATPEYHQLSIKTLLHNSSIHDELRSLIAAILGSRVLEFQYAANRDPLKESISKRLLGVGDARHITRTQVTALEKKLEELSGFAITRTEVEDSSSTSGAE